MGTLTDDFEAYGTGSLPSAWGTEYGDHTWTVESDYTGSNVLRSTPGTSTGFCLWDDAGAFTSCTEALCRGIVAGSSSSLRLAVRFSGDYDAGTAYCYMADINAGSNVFTLRKIVNGSWTTLASVGQSFSSGAWYWLRISAVGTAIKASWGTSKAAAQASWVHEVTDSDVSSAGKLAVSHGYVTSGNAEFDDVEATSSEFSTDVEVTPAPVGTVTIAGNDPTVIVATAVSQDPVGTLEIEGYNPTVLEGGVSPVGTIEITGYNPTVVASASAVHLYMKFKDAAGNVWTREIGRVPPVVETDANRLASSTDEVVIMDASGGNRTYTLPTLSGRNGFEYSLMKSDASANTVTMVGTINGSADFVLASQHEVVTVCGGDTSWWIL